ncbi:MAG: neutral/alkaline non-lysosomal ceramidase N-terminal domain-containing protein [Cytophagales bacterium]|nr:neutral/alkaline non-lysosomal ceramidase N-terminal domain-containing protein [Cytophagales bacterium]
MKHLLTRKRLLRFFLYTLLLLVVAAAALFSPVDRTPYRQMPYYEAFGAKIAELPPPASPGTDSLRVGWAKVNITPGKPQPTAGYGQRFGKPYTAVHDSIWVRAFVFDNGTQRAALITADLLIIAPEVTNALARRLPEIGLSIEQIYLCATHSHNSIGAWADKTVGRLIAGKYDPEIVNFLADRFLAAIREADQRKRPATLGMAAYPAGELVHNRLRNHHPTDSLLRVMKIRQNTGAQAAIVCFAAHATMISDQDIRLSRDYPGVLVDTLEKLQSIDFAAFAAGAVGSQSAETPGLEGWAALRKEAGALAEKVAAGWDNVQTSPTAMLRTVSLPLLLRSPHFRVAENWRIRPWVFYWLYGDYPSVAKGLRIGDAVWVGLPCDFSGELTPLVQPYAQWNRQPLFLTSFNGGYIGYVTPDAYYDWPTYETRDMNWFGPYNGAYFVEAARAVNAYLRK